eukprot:m.20474 g.20474  ORF g.20474 m.20474 type:complete len:864 (+) comp8896_c0_seq1:384-2975(+)
MVEYLNDFQRIYEINVRFNSTVTRISRQSAEKPLVVHIQRNDGSTYRQHCLPLVVATGTPIPSYPRVAPGIENTEGYEDFDPSSSLERFRGKRVLILGAGNSAFEVANNISGVTNFVELCSRNPPKFSWQTHYAGDVRSINAAFLDTYQLKAQNFISTCVISAQTAFGRHADGSIEADTTFYGADIRQNAQEAMHILFPGRSNHRTYSARAATYDHVIRCLGFQMDPTIFDPSIRPDMDQRRKYPLLTPNWESTNIKDVYFAGTLMAGRDQKRSAVFAVHGFRYAVESLSRVIAERYKNRPWPTKAIRHDAAALASTIIERVQYSSSLYQMYLSMCEVFWFDRDCSMENHMEYEDLDQDERQPCWQHISQMPCDKVFTSQEFLTRSFIVVTLEYHPDFGKTRERHDVFGADHVDPSLHPDEGYKSNFLHPVIRYYSGLRFDGSEHVHFTHVNPELAPTAHDVTEWQSHKVQSQAVAIHHMMESVFIDFAHLEGHIEPLVRFLAGLLATRPELLADPHSSPIYRVKLKAAAKQARTSLHPQAWLQRNLNMEPEELLEVMTDIQRLMDKRQGRNQKKDTYRDHSAWDGMAMLRGVQGVRLAENDDGTAQTGHVEPSQSGTNPLAGMTQEQMKVFIDALGEALDKPVGGLPELADIEDSVAAARLASTRLTKRMEEQKRAMRLKQQGEAEASQPSGTPFDNGSQSTKSTRVSSTAGNSAYSVDDGRGPATTTAAETCTSPKDGCLAAPLASDQSKAKGMSEEKQEQEQEAELSQLLADADEMLATLDNMKSLFSNFQQAVGETEDDFTVEDDVDTEGAGSQGVIRSASGRISAKPKSGSANREKQTNSKKKKKSQSSKKGRRKQTP